MEEYQARKQPSRSYQISHNLAHQPYDLPNEDLPLEEDGKVVQMPTPSRHGSDIPLSSEAIADEPSPQRSPTKRKTTGKSRSTTSKAKSSKAYASSRTAKAQPFADELQHLEDLAERINHILEERARKKAYQEQIQAIQSQARWGVPEIDPRYAPPAPRSPIPPSSGYPEGVYGQPPLETEDTESLKQQARRIRQRLSQLEARMNEEDNDDPVDFSAGYAPTQNEPVYRDRAVYSPESQPPTPNYTPPYTSSPDPHHSAQARPNPFDPIRQRAEYEHWRAAEELRLFQQQEQWTYPETDQRRSGARPASLKSVIQPFLAQFRRIPTGTFLEMPRRPMDWLNDAAMWMVLAAIARIASRYVVMAFPFLSPLLTVMMFVPAGLAIFLVFCMPKTGWVPIYRLFLIMVGLIIGGKLF
jgi:hypothetical protein